VTTRLRALSGDAALLEQLRVHGLGGRVHSVFARAVNVTSRGGGLVTLGARELDDGPATLVLDAAQLDTCGIAPGATVTASGDVQRRNEATAATADISIRIGPQLTIDCAGARPWHARLPAFPADTTRLRANLAALQREAQVDLGPAAPQDGSALAAAMRARLRAEAAALRDALVQHEAAAMARHARALLGLGAGLTPSGDDFLTGLFAVAALPGSPCAHVRALARQVAAQARQSTNAISAAMLAAAARGAVRDSLQRLLRALIEADATAAREAQQRVLAIGASSGRDQYAGIVTGFECALAMQRPATAG
jgi:hypothetical protein